MEKRYTINKIIEIKNKGVNSFGLAGRVLNSDAVGELPLKEGHVYTQEDLWRMEVEEMLNSADNKNDFRYLGSLITDGIDNGYKNVYDYQLKSAMRLAKIKKQKNIQGVLLN